MIELLEKIKEVEETHKNHTDFYELAEKYGFCTTWCGKNCELCERKSCGVMDA